MPLFSRFRRPSLLLATLLALACGGAGAAGSDAASAVASATPGQELTPQIFHDVLLAEIALARGRTDVALSLYQRLLESTRDARVARRATEIAIYARRMDVAQAAARLWAELEPDSEEAQQVLSGSVGAAGMSPEQIEMRLAEGLAKSGARLPGMLLGLNGMLGQVADKAQVRRIVERVTEPYLEYAEAHFARAHAASGARDFDASLDELDQALARRPDWEQAVLLKAQILQGKDPAQAVTTLERFLSANPDSPGVRRGYARALLGVKRYGEARAAFEVVLGAQPDDQSSRFAAGMIALEMGDFSAAAEHLETLRKDGYPDEDALRMALGQVAEAEGDQAGALAHYEAVAESPRREQAQMRIAQMFARGGDIDSARARLRALGDSDKSRVEYLLVEAQILRDAGRVDDAVSTIDEGLRLQPDDPDLLYESAMLAERMNRLEAMEGRLRKLIALQPDYAHAYNALGYSLADRGMRLPEAEALIRKAVELRPEDPFILDSLGWVRYRRGALGEARGMLERAYALRSDPEIAAHLGEVMWEMGDQDAARELWRQAADAHPDNDLLSSVMRRYGQ